mgnify:CR=1 FL=1
MPAPLPADEELRALCRDYLTAPDVAVGNAEWAARCGRSERSFTARFRAATGSSPAAWRRRARLLAALPMLCTATVTETAGRLGYATGRAARRSIGGLVAAVLVRAWVRAGRLEDGLAGRGGVASVPLVPARPVSIPFVLAAAALVTGLGVASAAALLGGERDSLSGLRTVLSAAGSATGVRPLIMGDHRPDFVNMMRQMVLHDSDGRVQYREDGITPVTPQVTSVGFDSPMNPLAVGTFGNLIARLPTAARQLAEREMRARQVTAATGLLEISSGRPIAPHEETLLTTALRVLYGTANEFTLTNAPLPGDVLNLLRQVPQTLIDATARDAAGAGIAGGQPVQRGRQGGMVDHGHGALTGNAAGRPAISAARGWRERTRRCRAAGGGAHCAGPPYVTPIPPPPSRPAAPTSPSGR